MDPRLRGERARFNIFNCRFNIDAAIKHVDLDSINPLPREGGGLISVVKLHKNWIPAFAGKGRASTYLIAGSIEVP